MSLGVTMGSAQTTGGSSRRWLFAVLAALMLFGGSGWLAPDDASAGQAATVITEGAPLFVDHDDHTVMEWMEAGTRVDVFWGPHNWLYEIRYYGTVGWTWAENLDIGAASGGGGGESYADTSAVAQSSGGERWIDVNRSTGAVTLFEGNNALYVFWGSLSRSQGEDFWATASGTYYVYAMNSALTYTEFADAYITHWVGFDPDRRNGFHSWVKDANGNYTAGGAGYSGGCVMLPTGDAAVVYDFAYIGMRVEVHW